MHRDDLIGHIDEIMSTHFTKDGETWTLERDVTKGGGVMIINGQRMNNPGETHHLKLTVEVVGEGGQRTVGSETFEEFLMIDFTSNEDDGPDQPMSPTECLYYDDFDYFDQLVHHLFGI